MTTSRRLVQLEQATSGSRTTSQHLEPLCELLGLVDGLHWPYRQHGGRVAKLTSIVQQRRAYRERGLAWSLADGTARGWKQAQRLRDSMESQGWIRVHREGELRVRLTTQGDCIARAALGLPVASGWLPMRLAARLSEIEPDRPGGWLSEFTLAGTKSEKQALADCLLPLLAGGIVESLSSTTGEIFYRPTGQQLPDSPEDASESMNDEQGDKLHAVYSQAFEAALSGRERIEPTDSEVVLPLSASKP
jgi:hypothetical protein